MVEMKVVAPPLRIHHLGVYLQGLDSTTADLLPSMTDVETQAPSLSVEYSFVSQIASSFFSSSRLI